MPKIIAQPDDRGGLPKLYTDDEARKHLRAGRHKWLTRIRDHIEYIDDGGRSRLYTEQSLIDYQQRRTRKPEASRPRRAIPAKPVPPPAKGPKPRSTRKPRADERSASA